MEAYTTFPASITWRLIELYYQNKCICLLLVFFCLDKKSFYSDKNGTNAREHFIIPFYQHNEFTFLLLFPCLLCPFNLEDVIATLFHGFLQNNISKVWVQNIIKPFHLKTWYANPSLFPHDLECCEMVQDQKENILLLC